MTALTAALRRVGEPESLDEGRHPRRKLLMSPATRAYHLALSILMASLCGPAPAAAQAWPSRPITLVVAFPAGTTVDYAARAIAQHLSGALGQNVIVESRTGGGGVIASASVAKAAPDGYTLLMTSIGPAVLRPLIDAKLHYDAVADFTPIMLVGEAPNLLVSSPALGFRDVHDLVVHAKQNPGKLTIGHSGPGTMGHLVGLTLASEAAIDVNLVAYAGSPPIIADLAGGHIDVGSIAYGAALGNVKVLAVTTDERPSFLPDVPTMRESGFPGVTGATWSGLFAPAGLPPDIVAKLNASIDEFLRDEATRTTFDKVGYRVLGGTPERLRRQMSDDRAKWSKVIAAAKISADP
jgi:tripartite-type tricarboxylate transporter receptor subunit TctC